MPPGKSFIYIKESSSRRTNPYGTPEGTLSLRKRSNHCELSLLINSWEILISLRRLPEIWLVDFLSNVLGLSEKTTLTFIGRLSSNDFCILCIILKTCELQVSPGRKPDGQTLKSSFSIKSQTMTWISSFYYYLYII